MTTKPRTQPKSLKYRGEDYRPYTLRREMGHYLDIFGCTNPESVKPYFNEPVLYVSWNGGLDMNAHCDPIWPGVALPPGPLKRWFLLPNDMVVGFIEPPYSAEERRITAVVSQRVAYEDYWPSPERVRELMPVWVDKLYAELERQFGEGDCNGPFPTIGWHWSDAKRRYGVKSNPVIRRMYIVGVDPEGRSRNMLEECPEHILEGLREADRLTGLRAGATNITEEELYGVFA